jgi:squalene cyclase
LIFDSYIKRKPKLASVPDLDYHTDLAKKWLLSTWRQNESGVGWAHHSAITRITEWGGTLDGVRGLCLLGENPSTSRIRESIDWLLTVQKPDGGWSSWEIHSSCTEATCWCLISLLISGRSYSDDIIQNGVKFLKTVIVEKDDVAYCGAYKDAEPRVYPTLLALWVLSQGMDSLVPKLQTWLLNSVNKDGGWGFKPEKNKSNPAITAMVIYSLVKSSYVDVDKVLDKGLQWLVENQTTDGEWKNVTENWLSDKDENSRTQHSSTPWAIIALLAGRKVEEPLFKALSRLCDTQESDGSWLYDESDPLLHTWHVTNCAIALEESRKALSSARGTMILLQEVYEKIRDTNRINRLLFATLFGLIFILILNEFGFWTYIFGVLTSVGGIILKFIKDKLEEIIVGLIIAVLAAGGGYFWNKVKKKDQDIEAD